MNEITDESIATQVQQGNIDAYGELIARYEAKLKRYARKFLSSPDDIDDLVQDVFIKTYTNIQSFNTAMKFSPWIYRIAHNVFVNELKKKSRYSQGVFDADKVLPFWPAKETADTVYLESEQKEEFEELLSSLPPKYREVLVLHHFEELSYQEISDVLKIPVTTVGVRINRGRNKLRAMYEEKKDISI